jgi:aminoglycoside phosphotransferase family enzyme/predicted kinase
VTSRFPPLIEALRNPACYDHPVEHIEVVETHISWVLLTGRYAYKIKKPLDLGFLDFSTLDKRRFYCEEELRLNRRLAPEIYLDVIAIAGTPDNPRLGAPGQAIEYAVKMVQFPQAAQLDRVLASDRLEPAHIDAIAATLAAFHGRIPVAGPETPFGNPERVYLPMDENFRQIRSLIGPRYHAQLERLKKWSERTCGWLQETLAARKRDGFVRECHGDAHLANMALIDGRVTIFDCIEFSENLRWIDVMNELAFFVMDLDDRGRPDFARRALNGYLERTGDYAGVSVLRFYQVYRALVRAKVAAIRLSQKGLGEAEIEEINRHYRSYAELAERYTRPLTPGLIITHGLSGSGKTTIAQRLIEHMDVIRVRSDVERKRLHGLAAAEQSGSGLDTGLYAADATVRTYRRLAEAARAVLAAGFPVVLDAAFLRRAQRDMARALAAELRVPFVILDIQAPVEVLRARVAERAAARRDASEADLGVLEHQLATAEALAANEREHTLTCDGANPPDPCRLAADLQARL